MVSRRGSKDGGGLDTKSLRLAQVPQTGLAIASLGQGSPFLNIRERNGGCVDKRCR